MKKHGGISWVVVKVDERLKTEIAMGSKTLILDPTYDVYKNTKIKAEVVAPPVQVGSAVLYEQSVGFPYPTRIDPEGRRYCIKFQSEMVTTKDPEPEVEQGDIVYFHYLSLSDHNFLGKEDGMELYKVKYEQLFCRVRNDEIYMLNGYIAVSAVWDESYEDVSITDDRGFTQDLRVKQTKTGIIYDINDTPVFRHGTIAHRGKSVDGKEYDVREGDQVIYTDFSEFKNTIEGTEYYIMKLWDLVAVYKGKNMIPLDDYVFIDVTPASSSGLIIPEKYQKKEDEGKVIEKGISATQIIKGREVKFNPKNRMDIQLESGYKRGMFIRESEIYLQS